MSKTTKDLMRYDAKTFELIPLHRPKAVMTLPNGTKKQVGKAPVHAKWTTKTYDSAKVRAAAIEESRNVGVRLKPGQLVVDVDFRNGGEQGFLNLCHDIGFDGDAFPRVITGSGSFHVYMSKPEDVLVRDTLDASEYDGVEFKSKGRQVVAAGSTHPNGKPYYWSPDHPKIEDGLPKVPRSLLNIIKRPPRSEVAGGGQYSCEQIAAALDRLDPTDFGTNDKWFPLMQACHHASAGDARQEWVDWSTSDPAFTKDAYMIGKRWDSLHADRNDGVTYRTLNKILRDAGASDMQAAAPVADDEFPDDEAMPWDDAQPSDRKPKARQHKVKRAYAMFDGEDDDEEDGVRTENIHGWPDESVDELNKLNRTYVSLFDQGKFRIMFKAQDINLDREFWQTASRHDFESFYANRNIERDMTGLSRNAQSTIPLGEAWIKWPGRQTVKGIIFEPDSSRGERDGYLNLWSGWGMQPDPTRKGSWQYMRELISDVICDGDARVDSYIMNWLALLFQKPSLVPGTALVFRGGQGVGKGTLGNALCKIIGPHAMAIGKTEHLTGRFNAHFRNTIFLFADEVVAPYGDRAAESAMKSLITEPTISIERKGVDMAHVKNVLHVMMASNEKWVVPAAEDERRYMVQHVTTKWRGLQAKWNALHAELEANDNAGYRAMLTDLMFHEIPDGWNVRDLPMTTALVEQKLFSLSPVKKFFHNQLIQQQLGFTFPTDANWSDGKVKFFLTDFKDAFGVYCRANDMKAGSAGRATLTLLKNEIKDLFPSADVEARLAVPSEMLDTMSAGSDGKALAVVMPDLATAAREFEKACGLPPNTIRTNDPKEHGFG